MNKPLPQAEYIKSLSKKRLGVSVLFFDKENRLLLLKPNYRDDGWTVPGGTVDAGESPRQAAIREIKEEIGLEASDLKFLLVEHVATVDDSIEGIEFVFYGGVLAEDDISKIIIPPEEFDEIEFLEINEALSRLRESVKRRTVSSLEIIESGVPAYVEF